MCDTIATIATEGGNTITPSSRDSERRRWCGVLNNYTEKEFETLRHYFGNLDVWIIGKEVGECGTPHLQFYFEKKVRFSTLKKINDRLHLEGCRGDRASNLKYCMKEGNYIGNGLPRDVKGEILNKYKNVVWKPWQQEVIDKCEEEPDDRSIYWYWEETGNIGKSFLVRYLYNKYDVIIGNGKMGDVLNNVRTYIEVENKDPRIIILDIPRSSLEFINYGVIEKLKDKLIYSGKYEGGTINIVEDVHVIVFANEPPKEYKMSEDRWKIKKLE